MRKFSPPLPRFLVDRHGHVGVMFALTVLPAMMLIGLGVDYSRAIAAKSSLDAAADSAALGAATYAQYVIQSQYGGGDGGAALATWAGDYGAQQFFTTNVAKTAQWTGATPNPTINVNVNGRIITAQVSYQTTVKTAFGGLFGVNTLTIGGSASSSLTLPTYMNISVAVDISQSMGLASTQAYMDQLRGLTGCAFGCHIGSPSNEDVAHANKIELRIDVIREATQKMIETAKSLQGNNGLISFALYTLHADDKDTPDLQPDMASAGGQALGTLMTSTTDYDQLIAAAKGIDLGPNDPSGIGDTHFDTSMPLLTNAVPASGDGTNSASPQQFAFIMTDGVQDIKGYCTDGHCTKPFDPSECDGLKAKGVTVGVIYTTYLAMPEEQTYRDLVMPFADQLSPNLKACASPGWFYEASEAADIQAAINALFARATSRGILTQ